MNRKVVVVYKNSEGEIAEERMWVQAEGENYKLDNIPFFAPNLALNDIFSVEEDEGILYFDALVKRSGHSTLQVIFFKEAEVERVLRCIEEMGCAWEGLNGNAYFAIDVPPHVDYQKIRIFLDNEFNKKTLDFKKACLSENHK